jgi:MYXO-CTERM domain-containing protein
MKNALSGLGVLFALTIAEHGQAQELLNVSGRVALLDGTNAQGTRVELGIDVDRDGDLNSFEIVTATVGSNGRYTLRYQPSPTDVDFEFIQTVAQLLADYQARGFEALLDDGPLPVILKIDREGYSTIVKRFTTLTDAPSLDVLLEPLAQIQCTEGGCMSSDGQVRIEGFPGGTGIVRAFARAHDPQTNTGLFPGSFSDDANNLLISSGFTEIDLRDENGEKIHSLSSPVSVRFEAKPNSWASLRDLEADSGDIEVPMYSFDEGSGEWVSEQAGLLQDVDGANIPEEDFAAIQAGDYGGQVFVAFETSHFSTFNCDAPVTRRACVKGRMLVNGEATAGVRVSVNGVSYTGTAGSLITGADGSFATDLMKSETSNEDVDSNGQRGETFTAQLTASATLGVYIGAEFDTPTIQGSVGTSVSGCQPADCECVDLGDIDATFEPARPCQVTVRVTYSGNDIVGSGGPFVEGDAIVNAEVSGSLSGQAAPLLDPTQCNDVPCGAAHADANGVATFIVPVVGGEPNINVQASYSVEADGTTHYYDGSITIAGCGVGVSAVGEIVAGAFGGNDAAAADPSADGGSSPAGATNEIVVSTNHAELSGLGDFIAALGDGPAVPGGGGIIPDISNPADDLEVKKPSCGCRFVSAESSSPALLFALGMLGATALRRRGRVTPSAGKP